MATAGGPTLASPPVQSLVALIPPPLPVLQRNRDERVWIPATIFFKRRPAPATYLALPHPVRRGGKVGNRPIAEATAFPESCTVFAQLEGKW
jgi:hypothetical protein